MPSLPAVVALLHTKQLKLVFSAEDVVNIKLGVMCMHAE